MLENQVSQNALFQYFRLENVIPEKHILLRLHQEVDFSFIRPLVEPLYAKKDCPSIDSEVAFRVMVLGYHFDLNDHRLHQ